jgi:hypothetical protein
MAYLPGERPLVNPWLRTSDSADLEQSTQTDELSVVCLRGVSGPGSSFVEWGEEGRKTKLIAVVKGTKMNDKTTILLFRSTSTINHSTAARG